MSERFLTVKDLMERWGVKRPVVMRLVLSKVLPAISLGERARDLRFREASIVQWESCQERNAMDGHQVRDEPRPLTREEIMRLGWDGVKRIQT